MRVPDSLGINSSEMDVFCGLLRSCPPGPVVEVGVYQGASAYRLAQVCREQGRSLHLFDTFRGMPWEGPDDKYHVGDLADCDSASVQELIPDAAIYVGVFPDTLPKELSRIAFAHIDCDQYLSVKACIEHLWPILLPGGILYFDDYHWIKGATDAIEQAFPKEFLLPGASSRAYVVKPIEGVL